MEDNLEEMIGELLRKREEIDTLLKDRYGGIFRSGNMVADFGEYLASKKLDLVLEAAANARGHDAIGKDGKKYQVKTRKEGNYGMQLMFPVKRDSLSAFDYLVCVALKSDWKLHLMAKIPSPKSNPMSMIDSY